MRRLTLLVLLGVAGCSILPGHWRSGWNADWHGKPVAATASSWKLTDHETKDGRFVGLTLSGGGSRAANFSAAVMLELQRRGLLEQVDVISAISGGALPAAYYGLGEANAGPFDEPTLRKRMGYSYQRDWLWRWFYPHNIFRYWLSDFTRSDIMVQVFNNRLYHNKTFADLQPHPKIFLSSTLRNTHVRFTFTDESFNELNSNLATYQIANAVNATSSFPGVFDDVTLEKYGGTPEYLHLYDGGPMDNLGVQAVLEYLLRAVAGTNLDTVFPNGCFIFVVDSAPALTNDELSYQQSSRFWVDYFVNTNALDASDAMLGNLRNGLLKLTGIRTADQDVSGVLPLPDPHHCTCNVRHIALRHLLYSSESENPDEITFTQRVTRIPTLFEVTAEQQNDLFQAAKMLVGELEETKLLPASSTRTQCEGAEKK